MKGIINDIIIRSERTEDFKQIESLVENAFALSDYSNGDEHLLVGRIRETADYIPELSLVAVKGDAVMGFVMFSRILINGEIAVAPAPLAVKTEYQNLGIGKLLMSTGHKIAQTLGYSCSVVLGNPDYYTRFGYKRAVELGIYPPFDVNEKYYMACQLSNKRVPEGVVKYSRAFGL